MCGGTHVKKLDIMTVKITDKVSATRSAFSAAVDDDIILFEPESGTYFGTGSVGARIWALIAQDEDIQVNELCDLLMDEFDVERNTCEREVLEFLSQLRAHGLINAT